MNRLNKTTGLSFIVILFFSVIQAYAVSWNASLQDCISGEERIECEQKFIIEINLEYDPANNFDNIAIDGAVYNGQNHTFTRPVNIQISQAEPKIIYPLQHFHDVDYYPYEEVIKVPNVVTGFQDCVDDPAAIDPTCGWIYDEDSNIVPDSQGFCCNKSGDDLVADEYWRGEERIGEQSTILNSFSTAHCYRPGELVYTGFEIENTQLLYEINMQLAIGANTEMFDISPSIPAYFALNQNPDAELNFYAGFAGEIPEHQVPILDNYLLYYPLSPESHPYVQNKHDYLMLVPREEVTANGEECDKIGLNHTTFRLQAANCSSSKAGDCLHNQLYHKHNLDEELLIQNPDSETAYLVRGMTGRFNQGETGLSDGHFWYLIEQHQVLLEIDADQLFEPGSDCGGPGDACECQEVTDLSSRAKSGKVQLTWTPVEADSYNVYRKTDGGNYELIANSTSTYCTYLDADVTNGTTYYYQVASVCDGVETGASNEASATPSSRTRSR